MSMLKQLFGFFVMISIIKMVCFPSETEIPEDNASLDRMDIKLTRSDFAYLASLKTEVGKKDAIRNFKLQRIHAIKDEKKKKA